jgi:trehalose/maltose hydrolase-like predicted phosphorylase
LAALCRAREDDPDNLFAAHILAWENRWQAAEAAVFGDENAQLALRFAVYSLISAANPDDPTISVGARALTGDAYHGHIFWDTEIYLLPFYTVTWPEAAEAMLRYRSTSLPAARAKAASLGYRGALFAWESTDTGEETTPESVIDPKGRVVPVLNGKYEQHISADVAYAVWQYWLATDDANFLLDVGAEIILETARFWASRGTVEADGRYHIRGVIGPDEYHEGVDDNAYTNLMARWNIARGIEVAGILALRWPDRWRTLQTRLDLSAAELEQWQDAARRMYIHQNADGIFEQFDGYFQHDPIDFAQFPDRSLPIDVQLGREQTQRSQVLKQADVVMALALLWDEFDPAILERNFRYYEARTAHGSSLSPSIHAQVAARLGDTVLGLRYFQHAADIDIADSTRSEAQGIHIATQGGLWQAAVLGFAGVDIRADGLHLDPHLPETWSELNCALHWHRREICIEMIRTPLTVAFTMQGRPCDIFLGATTVHLEPNQEVRYQWDADAHTWMAKT